MSHELFRNTIMIGSGTKYALILFGIGIGYFLVLTLKDLMTFDPNKLFDNFAKRTLWIWLPIYGLQRLIKEVIFKKK